MFYEEISVCKFKWENLDLVYDNGRRLILNSRFGEKRESGQRAIMRRIAKAKGSYNQDNRFYISEGKGRELRCLLDIDIDKWAKENRRSLYRAGLNFPGGL